MLSPSKKPIFLELVEELARCAMYAADPHVDCRDEISGIIDHCKDLVHELFEPDDQADVPAIAGAAGAAEKGGAK